MWTIHFSELTVIQILILRRRSSNPSLESFEALPMPRLLYKKTFEAQYEFQIQWRQLP